MASKVLHKSDTGLRKPLFSIFYNSLFELLRSLSNRSFVMEYRLFIIVFIYSPLILWVWYIGRNVIIHPINPSRERSRSNNNLCCEHVVLETPYGDLNYTWSASGIYVVLDALLHFDHNEELYLCLGNFSITRSIYF